MILNGSLVRRMEVTYKSDKILLHIELKIATGMKIEKTVKIEDCFHALTTNAATLMLKIMHGH